jgi:hypothetical protein
VEVRAGIGDHGVDVRERTWIGLAIAGALLLGLVPWLLGDPLAPPPRAPVGSGTPLGATDVRQPVDEPDGPAEGEPPTESEEPFPAPAREEPARLPVSFVVRVLDSRGDPARGAAVRIHRNIRGRVIPGVPFAAGATDAEGKARFEGSSGDHFGVQAQSEREVGYGQIGLGGGANEVVIRMEPTLAVVGTVLDRSGAPVCGAEVMLSLPGPIRGAASVTEAFWALTDIDGHVPIAAREVGARPYYHVVASGYRTAYGELEKQSLLHAGFEVRSVSTSLRHR